MNQGFQLIHDIIKLRWVPEIVEAIAKDHSRYSDISSQIEYISNTELNRKLAVLLERNVIEKTEVDGKEGYVLTQFGYDLDHIFNHFTEMSDKYLDKEMSKI